MSWKLQKLFALVAIAAALVINVLPVQPSGDLVAQNSQNGRP